MNLEKKVGKRVNSLLINLNAESLYLIGLGEGKGNKKKYSFATLEKELWGKKKFNHE